MQVQLTGRVTQDAKVNTVNDDRHVVNFSIALNHRYKTKAGEKKEQTTFISCAYWKGTNISEFITKGKLVQVTGRLWPEAYLDINSQPKAVIKFHADDIFFLTGKSETTTTKPENSGKSRRKKKAIETVNEPEITEPIEDLPF